MSLLMMALRRKKKKERVRLLSMAATKFEIGVNALFNNFKCQFALGRFSQYKFNCDI